MKRSILTTIITGGRPSTSPVGATNVVSPDYEIGVSESGSYTYSGSVAEALKAPTALRVVLSGTFEVGQVITATLEGVVGDVALGDCVWRFYGASDVQQTAESLLDTVDDVSGDEATYTIQSGDTGKFIRAEVDIIGAGGEVGETLYSQYNTAAVPSQEFWTATAPFTIDVNHDLDQTSAGTGVANSNQSSTPAKKIAAGADGIFGYDYNSATKNNGIAVGIGLASSSVTLANMIMHLVISTDSGGNSINVYEANVFKSTISNINPPSFGTTLRIEMRVTRSDSKIKVYTSTDGAAFVLKATYTGTLANSDLKMMARSTVNGGKVKGATLT